MQGKGLEKDGTLKQKEAEPQVANSRIDLLSHFVCSTSYLIVCGYVAKLYCEDLDAI